MFLAGFPSSGSLQALQVRDGFELENKCFSFFVFTDLKVFSLCRDVVVNVLDFVEVLHIIMIKQIHISS